MNLVLNINKTLLKYSQCIVYTAFLLSSCNQPNHFAEDKLRQIQDFTDYRDTEAILPFFNHENDKIRMFAAESMASIQDSVAIGPLLKLLEFDENEQVRMAAAFSLGQYQNTGLRNLLLRLLIEEEKSDVKEEIIIALGKCKGFKQLISYSDKKQNRSGIFKGLFYSVAQGEYPDSISSILQTGLNGDEEDVYYALASMVRAKVELENSFKQLKELIVKQESKSIIYNAAILFGRATSSPDFFDFIKEQPEYLVRLGFLKGLQMSDDSLQQSILIKPFLKDSNLHVREQAILLLLENPEIEDINDLLQLAQSESHLKNKYLLYKLVLSSIKDEEVSNRVSEQLAIDFGNVQDVYAKGLILQALSAKDSNYEYVLKQTFSTESIIVRLYGIEGLFDALKQSNSLRADLYHDLVQKSIKTYDVALNSIAALAMRDTIYYKSKDIKEDIERLEAALKRMKLPRDTETYSDIFITLQNLMGNPISNALKPEFNHPINWDLALRVPDNQKISIETDYGIMVIELWVNQAPGTVSNFVSLAQDGYFNNKRLHRVVSGFVIQDGCPRGDGYGSLDYTIRSEFRRGAEFERGVIGMASAGKDTEGCQWFITHVKTPHLNGRYTAFGKVIDGIELLDKLSFGDYIKEIKLQPN